MGRPLEDLTNEKPTWLQGQPVKRWQPISLPHPPPIDTRLALTFYGREALILVGVGFLLGFCCALFFAPSLMP